MSESNFTSLMGYSFDYDTSDFVQKDSIDILFEDEKKWKRKKIKYWGDKQEQAILLYNTSTSEKERNQLAKDIILPAFKRVIHGCMELQKFHTLPVNLDRDMLIEATLQRLLEKIHKFTPGKVGKDGTPAKAYSYFSTVAKNYILEKKIRSERILKNAADVETSIDLNILSDATLEKMSNYFVDGELDDYVSAVEKTKVEILQSIKLVIEKELSKKTPDEYILNLGSVLQDMIERWDELPCHQRMDFMRLLHNRLNIKARSKFSVPEFYKFKFLQEKVSRKKFPSIYNNKIEGYYLISDEEAAVLDVNMFSKESEIPAGHEIITMQDYDQQCDKTANKKYKKTIHWEWKKKEEAPAPEIAIHVQRLEQLSEHFEKEKEEIKNIVRGKSMFYSSLWKKYELQYPDGFQKGRYRFYLKKFILNGSL